MISVSFGADITTWGYLNYVKQHNFQGGISQPCPAVVGYIERNLPELLPKLFPVQSPMMCAAIYAKKEMKITDKLAFISPCIAKKMEIDDPNNKGYISYNVTFDRLIKYIHQHPVSGEFHSDEIEYGLGSIYPMPGGLKENVYWFLGESVFIRQIEGDRHMYHYLEQNKNNQRKSAWSKKLTSEQRFKRLNQQFSTLHLEDYLRSYTDLSAECTYKQPTDAERNRIFEEMNKHTPEERSINCSCCGYDSCQQMADAIFNGFNQKNNCIYYIKKEVEKQKETAEKLVEELNADNQTIKNQHQLIIDTVHDINKEFAKLYHSVDDMAASNESNAA